jgi:hypothetical protein
MRRSLSIIGGLGLGICLSQFPEYAQQYTQRLGGAVDELRVITTEFESAARQAGLTREAALERFKAAGDPFVEGRGRSMGDTIRRYEVLGAALAEIEGATGWNRLASLPRYLDTDIGRRTLEHFRPAVPVTMEGFLYAGGGFILGYFLSSGLFRLVVLPFRRRPVPPSPVRREPQI